MIAVSDPDLAGDVPGMHELDDEVDRGQVRRREAGGVGLHHEPEAAAAQVDALLVALLLGVVEQGDVGEVVRPEAELVPGRRMRDDLDRGVLQASLQIGHGHLWERGRRGHEHVDEGRAGRPTLPLRGGRADRRRRNWDAGGQKHVEEGRAARVVVPLRRRRVRRRHLQRGGDGVSGTVGAAGLHSAGGGDQEHTAVEWREFDVGRKKWSGGDGFKHMRPLIKLE